MLLIRQEKGSGEGVLQRKKNTECCSLVRRREPYCSWVVKKHLTRLSEGVNEEKR